MTTEYVAQGTDDLRRKMSDNQRRIRISLLYLVAGLLIVAVLYPILCSLSRDRTGDGSEYYAMEMAISIEHRPYVQGKTWAAYEQQRISEKIRGLQSADDLKDYYKRLTVNGGTDFNHFWFYPASAAIIGQAGQMIGLSKDPHDHYMLLHAVLVSSLILLCFGLQGLRGGLAAALILFASPALWYVNKVHTELFTITLTTASLACALRHRWAFTGLFLAILTSQNISFAAPAFAASTFALINHTKSKKYQLSAIEVLALALTPAIGVLHPFYYFSRFGSITPQLINGGAQVSDLHILSSFRYLSDPDIGLLPNWPLGVVVVVVAVSSGVARGQFRLPRHPMLWIWISVYILISMLAQGATTNVNSGGTFGPARYGLWYLCFFYPLILLTLLQIGKIKNSPLKIIISLAITLAAMGSIKIAWPLKPESFLTPSRAAQLIYGYVPWIWSPNEEVFFERNAGVADVPPIRPALVLGPRCRKALFIPGGDSSKITVYPEGACGFSSSTAAKLIARKIGPPPSSSQYFLVNKIDLPQAPLFPSARALAARDLRPYLGNGWSRIEPLGIWSVGENSEIRLRFQGTTNEGDELILRVTALWAVGRSAMHVNVRVNGGNWQEKVLSASSTQPQELRISLPQLPSGKSIQLDLNYDEPASPVQLGLSSDDRMLGIYLTSINLERNSIIKTKL
ncbi:hypothetical protein ACCQ13_02400 [Xanthomonas sp. NCPPB 1638]|uniref:hypothetical protein n=1 Tax=Xanthomonas TaxID=338 RepID=UPI001331B8EE|nr:hypothetical protein [Xanthomonas cucurbitae]WDM75907.1 hypothetical protein K6982_02400 [Xanthomonas cucurbitae]